MKATICGELHIEGEDSPLDSTMFHVALESCDGELLELVAFTGEGGEASLVTAPHLAKAFDAFLTQAHEAWGAYLLKVCGA